MSLYLDTSVIVGTIVVERSTEAVGAFLLGRSDDLIVSDFAAAEVAAAMSRLVRMGQLTAREAGERLADFDAWRAGRRRLPVWPRMTAGWPTFLCAGLI